MWARTKQRKRESARQIHGRNVRAAHYTKLWEQRTKWRVNNNVFTVFESYIIRALLQTAVTYFPAIRLTKWHLYFLHVWVPLFRLGSPVAFHHVAHNLMQDGEMAVNMQVIRPQWFAIERTPEVRTVFECHAGCSTHYVRNIFVGITGCVMFQAVNHWKSYNITLDKVH